LEIKQQGNGITVRFKESDGNIQSIHVGVDVIKFLMAGYNNDGSHEVYEGIIPGKIGQKRDSKSRGKEFGANWIGQTDVVTRIVLGYDGRISNIKFVIEARKKYSNVDILSQLSNLEYVIQWGTMTVQDAVDFCVLMIQTTTAIQRFSDGISVDPGDMPGVGGPIDVAVISPKKGFIWLNRKKLKAMESEINIDELENIK